MGRLGDLGSRALGRARRGLDRAIPDRKAGSAEGSDDTAEGSDNPAEGNDNTAEGSDDTATPDPDPQERPLDSQESTAAYGAVAAGDTAAKGSAAARSPGSAESGENTAPVPATAGPDRSADGGDNAASNPRGLRWRLLAFAAVTLALLLPGSFAIGVVGNDEGAGPLPDGWVGAERIVVTTAADGQDGSLRDAIQSAGQSGSDTVVELAPTTYRLTRGCERSGRASALEPEVDEESAGGDLDLPAVGGGVRLEGSTGENGNGTTIVQECPGQRVLHATGSDRVELSNVTLAGGQATAPLGHGSGGALLSEGGADVKILDSLLTSNSAEDTGGAVAVTGPPGTLELTRSVISGNSAGSAGGGVWVLGTLDASNATITDNQAGSNGGAVATDANLTFSTIVDNSATRALGGRQLGAATLTSFASYVAGGAGASASCSVERAVSSGYNVGDDTSCGFGTGIGDLADGPRDGVGLLGLYSRSIPARPPVRNSVLVDRVPPTACRETRLDGQGRDRDGDLGCDVGAVELPVDLVVPLTATASNVAEPVSARATYTG